MGYKHVLRKTWRENILYSMLVELTYRCDLDCYFCYNDRGLKGVPMTVDEYLRFFQDLRQMQVMNLILSGGEPLAHPEFLVLGRKARELGFVIRVKSNGHALRGEMARRIREEISPYIVEVSLHGACAETHDRQTRIPGSFTRLMENLGDMLDLGFRVQLNCTLTAWNENEIEGMFEIADRLGVRLKLGSVVSPRDDGDAKVLSVSATEQGLGRMHRVLAARAGRSGRDAVQKPEGGLVTGTGHPADEFMPAPPDKHCGAGSSGAAVDPYGNVYPCVQWRKRLGNLHETSIHDIWTRSPALAEIRELTVEAKKLVDGHGANGPLLHFCPGLALMRTGSPIRMYPEAERNLRTVQQTRSERESIVLPVLP